MCVNLLQVWAWLQNWDTCDSLIAVAEKLFFEVSFAAKICFSGPCKSACIWVLSIYMHSDMFVCSFCVSLSLALPSSVLAALRCPQKSTPLECWSVYLCILSVFVTFSSVCPINAPEAFWQPQKTCPWKFGVCILCILTGFIFALWFHMIVCKFVWFYVILPSMALCNPEAMPRAWLAVLFWLGRSTWSGCSAPSPWTNISWTVTGDLYVNCFLWSSGFCECE
jgi:hypothetical protein